VSTNVLIVGSGAREHALAWKLRQSAQVGDLFVAPGNPGTAALADNLSLDPMDSDGIALAVKDRAVGLVVVGPELPLAGGLADHLDRLGVPVFGPSSSAARIESSKSFAKRLMAEAQIPTASSVVVHDYELAVRHIDGCARLPVVKADGLAAGKGVTVPSTRAEALCALKASLVDGVFGAAGQTVILEERLSGSEVSAHAFCDGKLALAMPYACDHKAVGDGGSGPNTGGMGAYSPPDFVDTSLDAEIRGRIIEPALAKLADWGSPFRGTLYPGLMITTAGPKVIEFNCRFGDPEAEVLLPRLTSDLFDPLWGAATGNLSGTRLSWSADAYVAVVVAAAGYPAQSRRGDTIEGLDELDPDVLVFQAGTALDTRGRLVSAGGRVVTVVASGSTLEDARARAYANVPRIRLEGSHYRSDVGLPAR
jgi:phosphoribosylamine--glycine ligase